jgi:hypothetical protein
MTYKKLLKNIYYAALHHEELNRGLYNDLLRDDLSRNKAQGAADAYAFIKQMITHYDTIGQSDYKKVFDMKEPLPYFLNLDTQKAMDNLRKLLDEH